MRWVRPLQSHRRAVRRRGAGRRDRAWRPDGADRVRRHHARPSLPGQGEIKVAGFADYAAKLRAAHVVLDPAERKRDHPRRRARSSRGEAQVALKDDEGLLDEVAGLVEWPVPLLGTIDAQFMDVPPEVLTVSMRTHQSYFATDQDRRHAGQPLRRGRQQRGARRRQGDRRRQRARAARAAVGRQVLLGPGPQDRRSKSALPALKGIVFHAKLGTHGRAGRSASQALAGELAEHRAGRRHAAGRERAALLARPIS